MRSQISRALLVLSVACAPLALASTVAAAADVTVGEAFSPNLGCGGPYTVIQTASTAPSYTVPSDGVITSVRIPGNPAAPSIRAFKLARGSGLSWTIVGSTDPVSLGLAQTLTQNVRIPARQNDVLGVYAGENTQCVKSAGAGNSTVFFSGNSAAGSTRTGTLDGGTFRIAVSATVEPDADGDGYGDTTQDKCPTQASTQGLCNFTLGSLGKPSGTAKVGKRVTVPALAVPAGAAKTYQWFRTFKNKKHHTVTRAIPGATGTTYKLKGKDRGKKVRVAIKVSAPTYNTATVTSLAKKVH